MIKKASRITAAVLVVLIAAGGLMYARNAAPVVSAISAQEAANAAKPYVVKLHAKWCPKCMITKGVWSQIETTYAGRVHLLVLDFTTQANTDASRAEAKRLGLDVFFNEYAGATGTIVVLSPRTREVTASISGSRDFAEYAAAIDASLKDAGR